MRMPSVRPLMPALRIDGVSHDVSALAILDPASRIPGGLPWSLDFEGAAAAHFLKNAPMVRTGRPSQRQQARVFAHLKAILRGGDRPCFFLATIESIAVADTRVHLRGRCAPLIVDGFGAGTLTMRTG
jgi:hypothetical protein